ncbi:MAG: segregation/condensation protein A [Thermodesulfovibrionales bacterium]|nr:segregation/condensation protein A [Thermodesulfovibrionales bacterium]
MDQTNITTASDSYNIKIPAFEGPLDLLLHLIKENKVDIYDIPIAVITGQYLHYIEIMKDLNLDVAGDFLVMAATLIHIKSRMLLPVDEEAPGEEQEDPRLELIHRLLEYQAFKDASLGLREREEEWMNIFHREPLKEDDEAVTESTEHEPYLFDVNLFDLIGAFKKILDTAPPEVVQITREALTVKDKISHIMEMLENNDTVRFEDLFNEDRSRIQVVVTFVALLELIRLGLIRAYQEKDFGNIWLINPQKKETQTTVQG